MLKTVYTSDYVNPSTLIREFLEKHKGAIACSSRWQKHFNFSDVHIPIGCDKHPKEFRRLLKCSFPELHTEIATVSPADNLKKYLAKINLDTSVKVTTYQDSYCTPKKNVELEHEKEESLDGKGEKRLDIEKRLRYLLDEEEGPPICDRTVFDYLEPPEKKDDISMEREDRNPPMSEYVNTISHTGCMITRNHLHDHKGCGKTCAHPLVLSKCKKGDH
ncbi:uncharacterized protein LOC119673016 [Teleopsis dalmanni]|uniref:uncharacterized protein LOC119673016 n=1 Tax=Teleopsis dalmanni TaxID=139649 RepID=UPI0018CF7ACE|nr:uncharacterized protein LOC119673016 [Teleopsis dalmanni]